MFKIHFNDHELDKRCVPTWNLNDYWTCFYEWTYAHPKSVVIVRGTTGFMYIKPVFMQL